MNGVMISLSKDNIYEKSRQFQPESGRSRPAKFTVLVRQLPGRTREARPKIHKNN